MEEYAVEVNDLHVGYRITKRLSIKNLMKGREKPKTFEALKGVSFSVKKGAIVGVIGKNGSGKSTLLRTMAGIFAPDMGTIDLKGQTVSLLSIGVGFHNTSSIKIKSVSRDAVIENASFECMPLE